MIVKRGSKYLLLTHDGSRVLGTHPTRVAALRQERAVMAHKYTRSNPPKGRRRGSRDVEDFRTPHPKQAPSGYEKYELEAAARREEAKRRHARDSQGPWGNPNKAYGGRVVKRRRNPVSRDYPAPLDPRAIKGVDEILSFVLLADERAAFIADAKDAVDGRYDAGVSSKRWARIVDQASRMFWSEIGEFDEDAPRGHGFSAETRADAVKWMQMRSEHHLFGYGLHQLMRISQGDTKGISTIPW